MGTDQFEIDGDTAIVTGASRGIGQEIAERFLQDDVDVAITSREMDRIQPVADEFNSSFTAQALPVECDIRDREAVDRLVERTIEELGGLDVLINNAGASFTAPFEEISPNGWETIVRINLEGTYHCTQSSGEYMMDHGGGIIINMSSMAGQRGSPFMSHYGSAKAGVINLTRTLAQEWSPYGIRINCIAPGLVVTRGVQEQMDLDLEEVDRSEVDRNVGLTEEIADIVQFLSSPASSYIVGQTLNCEGVPETFEGSG